MKHQVESDRAAQHLSQIAGRYRRLAEQPVRPARPRGIPVAASLCQVFAGYNPKPRRDDLHEDRHDAGDADHPQQSVLELRSGLQIGAPVAGIHVSDADQHCRPDEGAPLLPEAGFVRRHRDGAVHAFEGERAGLGSVVGHGPNQIESRIGADEHRGGRCQRRMSATVRRILSPTGEICLSRWREPAGTGFERSLLAAERRHCIPGHHPDRRAGDRAAAARLGGFIFLPTAGVACPERSRRAHG